MNLWIQKMKAEALAALSALEARPGLRSGRPRQL
jgi:hypothetical protein